MKWRYLAVAVVGICIFALLINCGERRAEKEYARILAQEASGGQLKLLIDEYQALINKYPGTKAAGRAQERMAALKLKLAEEERQQQADKEYAAILEKESASGQPKLLADTYQGLINKYPGTKAAGRAQERMAALKLKLEEQERRQEAERLAEQQAEVERAAKAQREAQKQPEAPDPERERQLETLRVLMSQAAKGKARVLHPNYEVTGVTQHEDETVKTGDDGKSLLVEQAYHVSLLGGLLGVETKSVLIECAGTIRLNEPDQRFALPKVTKCEAAAGQ